MTSTVFVVATLFAAFAANVPAQQPQPLPATKVTAAVNYAPGQEAKVKGLIISRNGDDMLVRDENGGADLITLTADTKISSPSGLFKTEKKARDVSNLLPGLIIEVKGTGGDRGNLVADKVSFHSSALRVAEQIAAGQVALSMRVGANTDSINTLKARTLDSIAAVEARNRDSLARIAVRFDNIDKYDVKDSLIINFALGSDKLTPNFQQALDGLASNAMAMQGYLIEVTGFADATGAQTTNLNLSERRADAVVNYLVRDKGVPIRRVLNPTGFGEEQPAYPNDTPEGRALNRRVVVKVLVNIGNGSK